MPVITPVEVAAAALQGLVAGIFALAAFSKLRGAEDFGRFAITVRKLTMLSGPAPTAIAAVFAVVEAVTAALVAVPATARAGLWLAAALLVLFIGVVFRAVRGRVFAECGCFGDRSAVMSYPVLLRNLLFLALALAGALVGGQSGGVLTGLAGRCATLAAGLAAASVLLRGFDRATTAVLGRLHAGTPS
ncbi:MauE/DoxX family redox-associated membrane protein [Actinomadura logoneensis]|uniref:MauE/DoxX family redox-associated membrane protein n=1 Tax=Actinomadura logoneensis TaxID=2293572 RepID=UPI001314B8FC|nr:MauE/DoxX family redox-associated membrane protein [Actinomadura logoneensis]